MNKKLELRTICRKNNPAQIVGYYLGSEAHQMYFTLFSEGEYLLVEADVEFDEKYKVMDEFILAERVMFVPRMA